jgi:hypothetical protein
MTKFKKFNGRIVRHKYIMKEMDDDKGELVGYCYLCNWAVEANWKKTDIAKRVNCLNCKRLIKKFNKEHPNKDITQIKLIEG